jgi:hypothetical protein
MCTGRAIDPGAVCAFRFMQCAPRAAQALVRDIGDVTFHEAYRRTGVILNIPVSPGR